MLLLLIELGVVVEGWKFSRVGGVSVKECCRIASI